MRKSRKGFDFKKWLKNSRNQAAIAAAVLVLAVFVLPVPQFQTVNYNGQKLFSLGFRAPLIARLFERSSATGSVKMDVFVMSYCPFGRRFVLNTLPKIIQSYPDIDWDVYFIVNKQGDTFMSMHGDSELQEDMREACIREMYGKEKWLEFAQCFYSSNNFADCASRVGINAQSVEQCRDDKGKLYLAQDYQKSSSLQATASPTIVFNDGQKRIEGAYPFAKFNATIFELVTGKAAPNPAVRLYVIVPEDCPRSFCSYSGIVSTLENNLGMNLTLEVKNPKETDVDDGFTLTGYPAYIFDSSIVSSPAYDQLAQYLTKSGDYYLLRVRSSVLNREEKPNQLDLFVMSHCPYGNRAESAVREILDVLPDLKVNLWFIASERNGTVSSMHGQEEVNEDIRQVCIADRFPDKLWSYLACMNDVYSQSATKWQECAQNAGIDVSSVQDCFDTEGTQLLINNSKLANELLFGGSPTFLINNRYVITGLRSAEDLKNAICSVNDLAGCDQTLSRSTGATGSCG